MKTDKQKVIDLLTELGIGFTVDHPDWREHDPSNIIIDSDDTSVEGCCGFCVFEFDEDGKFKVMGIWE